MISIKKFKVLNTTSGKMNISGRHQQSYINNIKSHQLYFNNITEGVSLTNMPNSLPPGLNGLSHFGKNIEIIRDINNINNNSIYIPDRLRISYISGITDGKDSILFAWSNVENINYTELNWEVLFANCNAQQHGDYWDIDLPDMTFYPKLYLHIILLLNGWNNKVDLGNNTYNFNSKINKRIYHNNFNYSYIDKNICHSINIQGVNTLENINNRMLIGFEDWNLPNSDLDYNDIILSISSIHFDENKLNDNNFN